MANDRAHLAHFPTLAGINPPGIARTIGALIAITIATILIFVLTVPWVQTAAGSGNVIALDPLDRQQNITALVGGRIEKWYVTDGDAVNAGDPIVRIVDIDPRYIERLRNERAQVEVEVDAARQAARVAQLDVERTGTLFREGLGSRRDWELAQIKVADYRAKIAQTVGSLNAIDTNIQRQSNQMIVAPRTGRVLRVRGDTSNAIIKQGDVLVSFVPEETRRVVELYMDGRDISLIRVGRKVRLEFEGWPAIQFSGWPSIARGFFDGQVMSVDTAASSNGLYRILVEPTPGKPAWPSEPSVRLGASVRGWVLMDTVKVWFELWRLLNNFPLQYTPPLADAATTDAAGTPPPAKVSAK
ncbi:efflux RND transporter periplasmic adaptor subunit [Polymorphobacter fuscus]|uniref:HlyD family efflux transporter periplasmic adaptor subunit n=1 Tax=Sandarakinorhabdus fusca TaxID=1439888 RepID=A0A7C9GQR6_9SPHN|nr:biotin/lipoyl-binding protein [Polymorphobacter fuscus]KAB7643709.1 HlyD family efflux transporter periplasmic adaptor subunit [Polymorphobacter fuscus]MQT18652.1 HlyD family efflux transporter periplasmic adaptor subunit [Polymorphobacter fuscus]NJC08132.1 multidrug resistance efflux pump [Polymorphobacter fuscus]